MAMAKGNQQQEKRHRSIFDLPTTFLYSCRLLPSSSSSSYSANLFSETKAASPSPTLETLDESKKLEHSANTSLSRWSCNTCKSEFDSLQDQRSHFKSDVHRFNVRTLRFCPQILIFAIITMEKSRFRCVFNNGRWRSRSPIAQLSSLAAMFPVKSYNLTKILFIKPGAHACNTRNGKQKLEFWNCEIMFNYLDL